ncbi:MAG: transposase [Armatimonadetes bacterium]|nr:transposase [Armatimonadota bacterium]
MNVFLKHEPVKRLPQEGACLVTVAVRDKQPLFQGPERLAILQDSLAAASDETGWNLQAWALFANHVHFIVTAREHVGREPDDVESAFQATSTEVLNRHDGARGRSVWFRCWRTRLTFESSYLARVSYVHNNPVRHGLVERARDYPWCSAAWFEDNAPALFVRKVMNLRTDRVHVVDDF